MKRAVSDLELNHELDGEESSEAGNQKRPRQGQGEERAEAIFVHCGWRSRALDIASRHVSVLMEEAGRGGQVTAESLVARAKEEAMTALRQETALKDANLAAFLAAGGGPEAPFRL